MDTIRNNDNRLANVTNRRIKENKMIEKLDKFDSTEASIYHVERLYAKVNQLVDIVNELTSHVGSLGVEFIEPKLVEFTEPNLSDPYEEQRKWIGKLCKFWDIDNNNLYYGPLTKIHDTSPYCYECNHKMCYAFCEPVKDDVIYKGGDNE